jgi:hypothetical protein
MRALCFILLVVALSGCNIINPDEKPPVFVVIPDYSFTTIPSQGTNSEKFTEMWIYANDNIVSVTDVPAVVPVIADGPTEIMIMAGIKNNGIGTTRIFYPMIEPYRFVLDPANGATDTIRPAFTYRSNVVAEQADFDNNVPGFVALNANQGEFSIVNDPAIAFEGNRCGLIRLDVGEVYAYFKNEENFTLEPGNTIFLELNYSCNQRFAVGLISTTQGGEQKKNAVLIVNSTTEDTVVPEWNKIYVDFGLAVQQNPAAQFFEVYFEMSAESATRPLSLYMDNIKLVYFE